MGDFFLWVWLKQGVSWIMVGSHELFMFLGLPDGPGIAWVLSIVMLVIVMRILLIPLFFRQIKASRGMQLMQPELQAVQKKYKGKTDPASREAMTRETMELYRKHGTNPFASCMPILLQSPIFFALFSVLNGLKAIAAGDAEPLTPISQQVASDIEQSTLFGAHLSDVFMQDSSVTAKIVIAALIVAMSATTFFTQRQLTMKNMPPAALEGPMAQTQKIMLYMLPVIFMISGVNFPVGVLIYWTVTNLWSMGQQYYTIKRMPAPGSRAEKEMQERKARKAKERALKRGEPIPEEAVEVLEPKPRGQRVQPKRKDRRKGAPRQPVVTAQAAPSEKSSDNDGAPDSGTASTDASTSSGTTKAVESRNGTPAGNKGKAKTRPAGGSPSGKRKKK
ncbi:membrane protein insertase YidC [Myceligenerans pegani]|uniref:Membrane protein insertase YidC n=1 Tax=Myceligenerans pegani TaxID=2776917 RepID=A0ABR9N1H9_9MICO|nr:membrane protein insertase YidC [Myceligenerans sp. TRM 65318]MBE1877514.1 membrane protein insertase YidC [Myceligenerans sp. TRM 65318]MBE3019785.1 membrane protein insertase YidC [Myceligenerans sp. TRM 65318]